MVWLALVLLAFASPEEVTVTGSIRIKTDITGVQVFLDDQEVGETPLTISPVPAGAHRVTLIKAGYENHVQDVEVQPGVTARLFVVMKPSELKLPALPIEYRAYHQHVSGGCRGILTLSAEALDYRAHNGIDKFHIAVRDIRSVARSMGSVPFVPGGLLEQMIVAAATAKRRLTPGVMAACRIEAPGRGYGFWVYEAEPEQPTEKFVVDEVVAQKTRELYEVVYQLWTQSIKTKEKKR